MKVQVSISLGELIDKISILKIKQIKIKDTAKLKHVDFELQELQSDLSKLKLSDYEGFLEELVTINSKLWDIEDDIRVLEKSSSFGDDFIKLARSVYITNDMRFAVKNTINEHFGSAISEVKSYEEY